MPLFLARASANKSTYPFFTRASAREIIIVLLLAISAPAESFRRGMCFFQKSVREEFARSARLQNRSNGLGISDVSGRSLHRSQSAGGGISVL